MAAPCESTPTATVDGQFNAPHPTAFTLFKSHTWKGSEFEVTNSADGAAVMQVETAHIGYHDLCSLRILDAASRRPVIAIEEFATGSGRRRWEGFRGDGTTESDRLFVAVNKNTTGFSTLLAVHVFLGGNSPGNQAPDFVIHGCYQRGAMTVSRGSGSGGDGEDKDIAQIGRKSGKVDAHDPVGENVYTVGIKPGIDQALVIALTVVVDQMHEGNYCACCCKHDCVHKRRVHRH